MPDADDLLDPKAILFQEAKRWEAEIRETLAIFPPERTMFMPRLSNWQPIQLFAATADLFVGCDESLNWRTFCESIEASPIWASPPLMQNLKVVVKALPWLAQLDLNESERWIKLVKLTLPSSPAKKWLLYSGAPLSDVYRVIFTERHQAPGFIYVRRPANVLDDRWQAFIGDGGELAQAVAGSPPTHIIVDIQEGGWI